MTDKRPFHHGDLRAALISAAATAIERDGIENLSLRGLAQDIGVARSAPYRHFPTKQDLLDAVAAASRQDCHAAYAAIPSDLPPRVRLKRAGQFYLDYVRAHPNMVELIFADHAAAPGQAASESPLLLFIDMVRDAMPGAEDGEIVRTAMTCWSALHGFSLLALSGRTARAGLVDDTDDAVLDTIFRMVPG
ncbi:TetR/AcrR family transcriptional regulator [Mesobacterium pallidum]|uniref:TetR/AcrR family transcriptional regulator n=1 Tax=Mesobacterium pallidum TaxID=2872037 RepID=UPI001EE197C4|nr:TetR/AcrR family transcriptional regulator [Mesobacterium pallidum]